MFNTAISDDFLAAFSKIPLAQQKKVREFLSRFRINPTSSAINYEPLRDVIDKRVHSVRIGIDYRAIILHPDDGDVYVLVWVDHHDEAMDWARNKVFDINPVTGALQVVNTEILEKVKPASGETSREKNIEDYSLFDTFADDDLLRTGLPKLLLPAIRALRAPQDLDDIQHYLPAEAYEALFWVANLGYSIDQALGEVAKPPVKVDAKDLSTALNHPDSRRRFVMVKSDDELMEILNAPLAKWRIFLHPSQAALVGKTFAGPARVLGGAGTGKTVVAMHRAKHLAANVFTKPTERILFTTYNRNLANNIRNNLKSLCSSEFDRIEVTHLHSWAASFLRSQGFDFAIASGDELNRCWQDTFSALGTGEWNEAFFKNEWDRVIQAQGIITREEYLTASRSGQTTRLTRPQRSGVWEVLEEYRRNLQALGKMEWIDMIRQTRLYLADKKTILPYQAIIIDETQDLKPEDLKLLRAMVPEGVNDLFLVGDAHQRIYGKPVVLSQCGINIKGRSSKLKINYRTTEEIRNWSLSVLTNHDIDDLDGGLDSNNDYHSLLHGNLPVVKNFSSLSQEQNFLVETIKTLLIDTEPETICLVTRSSHQLTNDYAPALEKCGVPYLLLGSDTQEDSGNGIRLATMHRVKGLEFHHMIIAGTNAGIIPWESDQDLSESEQYENELQERCLFHVASTRARDTLTITSYGIRSGFLAE